MIDGERFSKSIVKMTSGSYTYFCFSAPSADPDTAVWQCIRVDKSATNPKQLVTYADGDDKFDNIATDPSALTYS